MPAERDGDGGRRMGLRRALLEWLEHYFDVLEFAFFFRALSRLKVLLSVDCTEIISRKMRKVNPIGFTLYRADSLVKIPCYTLPLVISAKYNKAFN